MGGIAEILWNWHAVYVRTNRWSKNGALRWFFEALQTERHKNQMETLCINSTTIKVHPNSTGTLKKPESKQSGGRVAGLQQRFIWSLRLTVRL
jgi:hypothetical protein